MPSLVDGRWEVRRSEVANYRRCERAWLLLHDWGLRPPEELSANPENNLWLGQQWHKVMEQAMLTATDQFRPDVAYEAGVSYIRQLQDEWGHLPAWFGPRTMAAWCKAIVDGPIFQRVEEVEVKLAYDLSRFLPDDTPWPGLHLVGTLDALVRDQYGNLWIMDHKTTSASVDVTHLAKLYALNDQLSCYSLLAQRNGYDVMGSIIGAIRKTDAAKSTGSLVGFTQQTRPVTALNLCVKDLKWIMQGVHQDAGGAFDDPIWRPNPTGFMECWCPGNFERICEAHLQGEDVRAIMESRFPIVEGGI